jgi:integrase
VRGEPFKQCGCRGSDGKQLGRRCPRLDERSHGAWYYRYSEPAGPDGRRRQPKAGPFPTKTAANTDRITRLDQLNKGVHALADRTLTVAADVDAWLAAKLNLKPSTRRANAEVIALYIKPGLGHLRLIELRPHHLDELYTAMRQIGRPEVGRPTGTLRRLIEARGTGPTSRRRLSAARMRRVHAVIHAWLADRHRREMITRNVAEHIQLPSGRAPRALVWTTARIERWLTTGTRPSPVMVWTPEQTGLFLDFTADDRHYPMWHLIAFRGLRRGEACGLPTGDLNLPAATVTIRTSADDDADPDEADEHASTKNRRDRTLALDTATLAVLTAHQQHQRDLREQWGDLWHDTGLVFTTEDGQPLVADTISQHFDRLLTRYEAIRRAPAQARDAGRPAPRPETLSAIHKMPIPAVKLALTGPPLPPIRLHDLRHVAATLAYRATKDLKLVSQLMGHSGIQITADIYTSVFEEVDRDAAEAVAALVPRTDRT